MVRFARFAGLAAGIAGLCALGCGGPSRTRRLPASVFQAARQQARHADAAPPPDGAAFVERALHRAGLRFGTDGTPRALWGYLRTSHRLVGARDAQPGDVVFFDVGGTGPDPDCADHAGIVESVAGDGRIQFIEARGGQVRRSFVDPARPTVRRDAAGQVVNTFLRPKRITDPPDARYFAGEMLCGIARVSHR